MLDFKKQPFKNMLCLAGIGGWMGMSNKETAKKAAEYTGMSVRTMERLVTGETEPSPVLVNLLESRANGHIPQDGQWAGFKLENENLVTPLGDSFSPQRINYISLELARVHQLEKRIRILEEENRSLKINQKTQEDSNHSEELVFLANCILKIAGEGHNEEILKTA